MKITVLKTTVETALAPVLKMAANARLSPDCKPTLTFQSGKQSFQMFFCYTRELLEVLKKKT